MSSSLIIECSTPQATIALVDGDGSVTQRAFTSDRHHNAMLFGPLEELLEACDKSNLEQILIGSGPGSYSGTRVGIAAAQGIGLALGCPVIAVPSILAVPAADNGAACLMIGDARRDSYWTSNVSAHQLGNVPQLCDLDALTSSVTAATEANIPVVAFESASRFPLIEDLQSKITLQHPDATRLWRAWQASSPERQSTWQAEIAQPIYLKPPHITPGKRPRLIQ